MNSQKGLVQLAVVFVLLIGILGTIFLTQRTQIFSPHASSSQIELLDNNCTKTMPGKKVIVCPDIQVKIVSPVEAVADNNKFELVPKAYAKSYGKGYYCKIDTDDTLIYHKECALPFDILCSLPWWEDELKEVEPPDECGFDEVCVNTSQDLFDTQAYCVERGEEFFPPTTIRDTSIFERSDTETNKTSNSSLRRSNNTVSPTPRASAFVLPNQNVFRSPQPTPRVPSPIPLASANNQPVVSPSPVISPQPSGNTGQGGQQLSPAPSPAAKKRTTIKYRIAESPTIIRDQQWRDYTVGGVTTAFSFSDVRPGKKFLYVQFLDNNDLDFDASPYPFEVELVKEAVSAPSPSPRLSPRPSASAANNQQAVPIACDGVRVTSGSSGTAGSGVTVQVTYKGEPGSMIVWGAANDSVNSSASQVGSWTRLKDVKPAASNVTFYTPGDFAAGTNAIVVELFDKDGYLADGIINNQVNSKCATSIAVSGSSSGSGGGSGSGSGSGGGGSGGGATCASSCGACPTANTFGNTTYDTCDTSPCAASGATASTTFTCHARDNSGCQGTYYCGSGASGGGSNNQAKQCKTTQSCGNPDTFDPGTGLDSSCPAGSRWCYDGVCVNENYDSGTYSY